MAAALAATAAWPEDTVLQDDNVSALAKTMPRNTAAAYQQLLRPTLQEVLTKKQIACIQKEKNSRNPGKKTIYFLIFVNKATKTKR